MNVQSSLHDSVKSYRSVGYFNLCEKKHFAIIVLDGESCESKGQSLFFPIIPVVKYTISWWPMAGSINPSKQNP